VGVAFMESPTLHLIVGLPGFRERASTPGARSQVHPLIVPKNELLARLDRRNVDLPPDTFHITHEQLDAWWALFEPPDDDELRVRPGAKESEQ
jgi:predicted kinase